MSSVKLYCDPIHHRTEEIRLILSYCEISFDEIHPNEFEMTELRRMAVDEIIDLPCLFYENRYMCESRAIVRYLAMENNLYTEDLVTSTQIEEICNYIDMTTRELYTVYSNSIASAENWMFQKMPSVLHVLEKNFSILKEEFLSISMADFSVLSYLFDYFLSPIKFSSFKSLLEAHGPKLLNLIAPLMEHESIERYLSTRPNYNY